MSSAIEHEEATVKDMQAAELEWENQGKLLRSQANLSKLPKNYEVGSIATT